MKKKSIFFIIITNITILSAVIIICYYFAFTTNGSSLIVKSILLNHIEAEKVDINGISGSLSKTLIYQDITIYGLKSLPKGNTLKIQRLEFSLNSFGLNGVDIIIHNGRLNFPSFDTILFYGNYQHNILNVKVYSNDINVKDMLDLFVERNLLNKLFGSLKDLELQITGELLKPKISGSFNIEKLSLDSFSMINCPVEIELQFEDFKKELKVNGQLLFKSGKISGLKTAIIELKESKMFFMGDIGKPILNIKGVSNVGDVKIDITLDGTFDKPMLKVRSIPEVNEDRLLLMLATNKNWKSAEMLISNQSVSPELVQDFLDYFVFSGSGDKIAQQYGMRNIFVKYDGKTIGFGATKDITGKTSVTYSAQQKQDNGKKTDISQKVSTEYKFTKNISVEGEKEIKNKEKEQMSDKAKADDRVMIKFKKEL